jgi:thymidylate synthase (FAD)
MKIIEQSAEILDKINGEEILKKIELAGRTCYQSLDKIKPGSAAPFVAARIKAGHESILEHVSVTVRLITDRGVLAELTRHRLASYSVESTRYCNYDKDITFIIPTDIWDYVFKDFNKFRDLKKIWKISMSNAEKDYRMLIFSGASPQEARAVLPMSTKTEIIMTANLREWRTIFKQRCNKAAHPQMLNLMLQLLRKMSDAIPVVFDDLVNCTYKEGKA